MLIIRPAVVTATLGAAVIVLPLEYIEKTPIMIVVLGTYLLTLLYWIAQYVSGVSRLLLSTQIAFDIFIITVIVHYTDGPDSFFFGFYLLSIMCASLFFRRLVTYLFVTQAAIFYLYDLFVLPDIVPKGSDIVFQTALYILLMYAVGFLSNYYAEKVRGKDTALMNALRLLKDAKLDTWDILQSMTNGLITVDTDGRIIYMNAVAEEILEIESGYAVGKPYSVVFEDRIGGLAELFDRQMISSGDDSENEIEVYNHEGSTIPLGFTSMPLYDTDGSRRGAIVNFKDLTEKKNLLEMLRQSERMAAIGELSAAIAHEIRNPLASISNAVEMLTENIDTENPHEARLLEVIEKESGRLQQISTDFLHFARMRNPDIGPLSLKQAIDDVLILVDNDPRNTDGIVAGNHVPEGICVLFDADQFRQLVLNIVINSLEVLEGKGEINISVATDHELSERYVRLVLADNGPGFQEKSLGSVFEPFYSTKKDGTGLGLALVRKIAIGNGGRVFARNRKGNGAEIILDMKKAE